MPEVFGSNRQVSILGTDNYMPQWECVIDGREGLRTSMGSKNMGNNLELCVSNNLDDGEHILAVRVTSGGATFALDRLLYSPSMASGRNADALWVGSDDSWFTFTGQWTKGNDATYLTSTIGASVSFNFTGLLFFPIITSEKSQYIAGTSASWYGALPDDFGRISTTAFATIDDKPTRVALNAFDSSDKITRTNQRLLVADDLSPGPHSITLTYDQGDVTNVPLSISYVVVSNAVFEPYSPSSATPHPQLTPASTAETTSESIPIAPNTGHHFPIGVVAGGVIGGVAFIILLVILFLFHRRRWHLKSTPDYHWATSYFDSHEFSTSFPIIVTRSTLITTDDDYTRSSSEPLVLDSLAGTPKSRRSPRESFDGGNKRRVGM
ncbi:hypothetical protein H0H87_005792 [Tephrocybe sp. NHM501043]|nr:hypothetical protein H0H87_005792 [Tephrocybe sp. NHM501043]